MTPYERYIRARFAANDRGGELYRAARGFAAASNAGEAGEPEYDALERVAVRFGNARRGVAIMHRRVYGGGR